MTKIKSKLSNVPETMLIPLRAKYLETKLENGIIKDPKSIEILNQIDYDFSGKKEVSKGSQKGVAIRTEILDELTNNFISKHKDAVVVNLGCGLDTRFQRLNNSLITWFDLDMPEGIELRKKFFKETENSKFISKSVFDFSWIELIPKGKPTLFIAEGVFMYFTEDEVKSIFNKISENFTNAEIIFDAMSPMFTKRTNKHPDVKDYNATFKWGIKTGKEIDLWNVGVKFINEFYLFDRHKKHWPVLLRALTIIPAFRKATKIIHLKFEARSLKS